ncbi:MAG: glycine--tRNA ligase subunit beta [Gammaproteobacteria bacterium]|nr:glycine--tRNA ligase subunit beta [Gammaproteobacteria bacterium]
MAQTADLLFELGTEELPPKALKTLRNALGSAVEKGLENAGLPHQGIKLYATPRRLALVISALATTQPDKQQERRGPAVSAAFDDAGNAKPAAQGFARSCGVDVTALERLQTDKGEWLVFRSTQPGAATTTLLVDIFANALAQLPIPKRMRWGNLKTEFVRPVHWVVLLFGDQVVDGEILGTPTGRQSRGHRFHHPHPITFANAQEYVPLLQQAHVIVDVERRREVIVTQVQQIADQLGQRALLDEALLDEVCALVEWPVALSGQFDARFLEVPSEALISSMQDHQKYFPVIDKSGALAPYFITVANIDSSDPEQIKRGNERVIRPRLADAAFFWQQDRKVPLIERCENLRQVVFQKKLGTLYDKVQRVSALAEEIALALGGDGALAARAAQLSKCDLLTEMVGEFPELQGVMGRYYAQHDGEEQQVADALDQQYQPRFAGDALPQSVTGQALAIADKLDTLAGIFAIGNVPTGDKDPFALRRAALGVLRIMIECDLDLALPPLLDSALQRIAAQGCVDATRCEQTATRLYEFMMERLRAYYRDKTVATDVFDAVLATRPSRPHDFALRVVAVTAFRDLPEASSLAAANKRIRNILKKAEEEIPAIVDHGVLVEASEQTLAQQIKMLTDEVEPLFAAARYSDAMQRLATLREPVDRFFDDVMVMSDDTALRTNRLALLNQLSLLFLRVADLSRLQG